ncbi:hypothetical protein EGJ00_02050 [Pseudomonas saudiphocaensis]|nr:hypothetical protein EGJ00_02050 [Pseudomonas saudiphocaensis]
MATVYHRDQPGAPALTYSTDANNIAHFTSLKTVLKACLVLGYGSQPAAGWELISEGSDYIVLRNGSHSGFVCLTRIGGGAVRVFLAETYEGMSGNIMLGAGLKSGAANNFSLPQLFGIYAIFTHSTSSSWAVLADSKTFVISLICNSNGRDEVLAGYNAANRANALYVGETSEGHFISVGGDASAAGSFGGGGTYFGCRWGHTSLKNPATGLLVDVGSLVMYTPTLHRANEVAVANDRVHPLPTVFLVPLDWFGGGVYGGTLRGLAQVPALVNTYSSSYVAQSLGRSVPLTVRSAFDPIDLSDGWAYLVRAASYDLCSFLLTDNPEFW